MVDPAQEDRQWFMSSREEGSYSGPYDTREEAIAEIAEDDVGFVGYQGHLPWAKCADGTAKLICGRSVLENLAEQVCGEIDSEHPDYDDWPGAVSKAMEEELEVALNKTLAAWMEKHRFGLPSVILGVERIDRREEAARG